MKNLLFILLFTLPLLSFSQTDKKPVKKEVKISKVKTWKFQKTSDGNVIIIKKGILFKQRKTVLS